MWSRTLLRRACLDCVYLVHQTRARKHQRKEGTGQKTENKKRLQSSRQACLLAINRSVKVLFRCRDSFLSLLLQAANLSASLLYLKPFMDHHGLWTKSRSFRVSLKVLCEVWLQGSPGESHCPSASLSYFLLPPACAISFADSSLLKIIPLLRILCSHLSSTPHFLRFPRKSSLNPLGWVRGPSSAFSRLLTPPVCRCTSNKNTSAVVIDTFMSLCG